MSSTQRKSRETPYCGGSDDRHVAYRLGQSSSPNPDFFMSSDSDLDPKEIKRQRVKADIELCKQVIKSVQSEILACHTEMNTLAPFNNLPQEVVSRILEAVPTIGPRYYYELRSMRLVCKAWTAHIEASPQYWKYAPTGLSTKFLKIVLQRARKTPMFVEYSPPHYAKAGAAGQVAPIPQLAALGWPVRSFRSTAQQFMDSELTLLQAFLKSPAPYLETLDMDTFERNNRFVVIPDLFSGIAPKLQTLRLREVVADWGTAAFPSLTTLSLEGVRRPPEHRLTVQKFMGVLRACPALESLKIDMPWAPSAPTVETDRIDLRCLKSLEFGWIDVSVAADILHGLTLPACENIKISCRERVLVPARFSDLVETVAEILPAPNVTVEIQDIHGMTVSGGRWTLTVHEDGIGGPTADGLRRLLVRSLPLIARNAVSSFDLTGLLPSRILPVLDEAFPGLVELSVTLSGTEYALYPLCGPTETGWLLPNLHTLTLNGNSLGVGHLAAVVEVARARGQHTGVASLRTFKTPLKKYEELCGGGRGIFEEMEELYEDIVYDQTPLPVRGRAEDADLVFSTGSGWHGFLQSSGQRAVY